MDSASLSSSGSSSFFTSMVMRSLMLFSIVLGVIPCSSLYFCCISRRLLVSSRAYFIEPVIVSAYMMTCPSTFRAALPMVWMSDVSDLRKPSLSASSIATRVISGMSSPSLRRLIPTSTSNTPRRRSLTISTLSMVSISECRYFTFISLSLI